MYEISKDGKLILNTIHNGNCLDILKQFPNESINCVITSPPYWGLRDYGTAKWEGGDTNCSHQYGRNTRGGLDGIQKNNIGSFGDESIKIGEYCKLCGAKRIDEQLGLESSFEEYIDNLCNIFDEIKRILKKEGTCWVNLGDTYSSDTKGSGGSKSTKLKIKGSENYQNFNPIKVKPTVAEKSLCQIPSRFAIEMSNRGWILRNKIIWHKPSCMPSSIKDRFTVDYEEVFFFVKSKKYYFEQQLEPLADSSIKSKSYKLNQTTHIGASNSAVNVQLGNESRGERFVPEKGRNKRTVWKIPVKPFKGAHFATFPLDLIKPMISAGCPVNGIVLDPFMGSGTTAIESLIQNKNYIGIELNKEYIDIANERINKYISDAT